MVKKRKKYSAEFKDETVRYLKECGLSRNQAAKRLEIPLTTLTQWVHATEGADGEPATTMVDRDELASLRRENEQLRLERDFLKKAAVFFAKETK